MAQRITYEEIVGDMPESRVAALVALSKKRRLAYLVALLVAWCVLFAVEAIGYWGVSLPYIGALTLPLLAIPASLGAYTNNYIAFFSTKGRSQGGLMRFVWLFFGALILPFIILVIMNRFGVLKGVLGWKNEL